MTLDVKITKVDKAWEGGPVLVDFMEYMDGNHSMNGCLRDDEFEVYKRILLIGAAAEGVDVSIELA